MKGCIQQVHDGAQSGPCGKLAADPVHWRFEGQLEHEEWQHVYMPPISSPDAAKKKEPPDLREALAALCHEQWSGWMAYLYSLCSTRLFDSGIGQNLAVHEFRREVYDRWQRQMNTPYNQLSNDEKESDRKEADRFLTLIRAAASPRVEEQDGWPGEWCKRCNRRNVIGFSVLDDIWDAVVRERWNVLCPACFDEEAQAAGVAYKLTEAWPITWSDWLAEARVEPREAFAACVAEQGTVTTAAVSEDNPIIEAHVLLDRWHDAVRAGDGDAELHALTNFMLTIRRAEARAEEKQNEEER